MKAGAENVFGVTIMPSYKFTPNWEGVVRYQMAAGSNAVKWEKRYTQNSTYSGTSDCMQALYLGVNYYIFECNPNMAKIMAGIEYAHSNGTDASKKKGFTGWSYNIAFRIKVHSGKPFRTFMRGGFRLARKNGTCILRHEKHAPEPRRRSAPTSGYPAEAPISGPSIWAAPCIRGPSLPGRRN